MRDKSGMGSRKVCGRCAKRPPIMVDGYWIDYCASCHQEWLASFETSTAVGANYKAPGRQGEKS